MVDLAHVAALAGVGQKSMAAGHLELALEQVQERDDSKMDVCHGLEINL